MSRLFLLTLPLLALVLLFVVLWWPDPSAPASGRLVFSDEFDGRSLDQSKWDWKYPRPGERAFSNPDNGEEQWYKRANVSEAGGALRLTAKHEHTVSPASGESFGYSSGLIQSKRSFNFRYGYMEARMWLPRGSGLWPAFWAWPTSERWPPEIDAMEFYGDKPRIIHQTFHYDGGSTSSTATSEDWTAGWHTFGVDWKPDGLDWYVDRKRLKGSSKSPALDMYLIANLAVCRPSRCSPPNGRTPLPATLKIDYIRVWKR